MLSKRYFKTKDEVEVTFEIERPDVTTAEWLSEATGWTPVPMKRVGRSDRFRLRIRLAKDEDIQFRYRFDDLDWENDEAADAYWPNEHGTDNSVVLTDA